MVARDLPLVVATLLALAASTIGVSTASAGDDGHADVCFEVATDRLPEEVWDQVVALVSEMVGERAALFPAPVVEAAPGFGDGPAARPSIRLDTHSGHAGGTLPGTSARCLEPDLEWTVRFGRVFLEASADRLLEEAPTTPGIASDVTLQWYPDEGRVRTLLTFAGPLDIPNGRCWVDDVLTIDLAGGIAVASGAQGVETSPFAEGACGRFFSHLPDGGAGQQAVTLLPAEIVLEGGARLRFVATEVTVTDDAVTVSGMLELR
jgi:hypothetical protein